MSKSVGCVPLAAVALVAFGTCLEGRAQVIIAPVSVLATPPINGNFSFDRTIDQSGLSTTYVSGVTNFNAYVASSPTHLRTNIPPTFGLTATNPPGNVDYDLGSVYDLDKMAFWNYGFSGSAAINSFQVYTSNDSTFTTSFLAGSFTAVDDGNSTFNNVQVFDLTDSTARYVRMSVLTRAGPAGVGFGYGEIAFGTAAIPEPSPATLGLVCLGLASLGRAIRRRR
ncbi:MAG: discoidin domain-containing protein [Isosphaeraceae bacterium]